MLWSYQAVNAQLGDQLMRSNWPDKTLGRTYSTVLIVVDHERLHQPYTDEVEFNRMPPSRATHALGRVPLLVRIQYMNQCHVLNGAAAMALVRHAERRQLRWTVGGRDVAEIGWQWGDAPDGIGLCIIQAGTERVKHQAHAHQMATVRLGSQPADSGDDDDGGGTSAADAADADADADGYILDLSVAQFGSEASLRAVPGVVEPLAGCAHSPTLAKRCAEGCAPGLFARRDDPQAVPLLKRCRVRRGQPAVERALSLVDASSGLALRPGYPLCAHMMPSPWFGTRRKEGVPEPDDDLVEGELLERLRKFEQVLERLCPAD